MWERDEKDESGAQNDQTFKNVEEAYSVTLNDLVFFWLAVGAGNDPTSHRNRPVHLHLNHPSFWLNLSLAYGSFLRFKSNHTMHRYQAKKSATCW